MKIGNKKITSKFLLFFLFISLFFLGNNLYSQEDFLHWEKPSKINNSDGRFPITINDGSDSYIFWQKVDSRNKKIQIMVRHYTDEKNFRERQLFGSFYYSGEVPDLYTVAKSKGGTIIVAVPSENGITIFTSRDKCETFFKKVIITGKEVVGPKVYYTSDGRFRLFYSLVDYKRVEKPATESVTSSEAEKTDSNDNQTEKNESSVSEDSASQQTSSADAKETKQEVAGLEEGAKDSNKDNTKTESLEPLNNSSGSNTNTLEAQSFKLYYMDSYDGQTWTEGKLLAMPENLKNPFSPYLIPAGGGDLVVFQAQVSSNDYYQHYQLFKTVTYNGGKTWETPKILSSTSSTVQDQRPAMYNYKGEIYLLWERSQGSSTSVMMSKVNVNGLVGKTERRSAANVKSNRGNLFTYNDELFLTWSEETSGTIALKRIIDKNGNFDGSDIEGVKKTSGNLFPSPLIVSKDDGTKCLYFVCQVRSGVGGRIAILGPDKSIDEPTLSPKYKRSAKYDVETSIKYPESDASGVKGYTYYWGLDSSGQPEEDLDAIRISGSKIPVIKTRAEEDGIYTLKVKIADNAGNWSKTVSAEYYHDITPPSMPKINQSIFDEYGFVKNNKFNISWEASIDENKRPDESDKNAAGYNYEFVHLGPIPNRLAVNKNHPLSMGKTKVLSEVEKLHEKYKRQIEKNYKLKSSIVTSRTSSVEYNNRDNGVYRFTICAIDEVGNVSDSVSQLIIINKYEPSTIINSRVYVYEEEEGGYSAEITGSGFTYDGIISKIYIDKDGKPNANGHYDLELSLDNKDYKVKSDTRITNIKIGTALGKDKYKIGVYHTDRGLQFTKDSILDLKQSGTVKFNPEYEYKPKYRAVQTNYKYILVLNIIIVILIIALIVTIVLIFINLPIYQIKEKQIIKKEVNSLTTGEVMPSVRIKNPKGRQKSLRGKIVGFTVVLIILIVSIITAINVRQTLNNQGQILEDSLIGRIKLLLGSVDSSVTKYMPDTKDSYDSAIGNLMGLPSQSTALPEANYITVLGNKSKSDLFESSEQAEIKEDSRMIYVWATNDKDENIKFINYSDEDNQFFSGISQVIYPEDNQTQEEVDYLNKLNGNLYSVIGKMENLESYAKSQVKENSDQITKLNREAVELGDDFTKNDSLEEEKLVFNEKCTAIEDEYFGSVPEFKGISLAMDSYNYLFYRPVLYRDFDDEGQLKVYNGLIVLEVNVIDLQNNLRSQVRGIIYSGIILAIIAIIGGIIGSWILAGIIVQPIKKLETHIQDVGNLLTKSARERMRLQKMEIKVTSKDEVGRLGEVVNKMSSTVGKAAEDELLEADGKVVQQKFIPLADGEGKYKLPIVKHQDEKVELYAFYKGDSDVSGDYFDYRQLDDRWYVFIKCDVSGHGTPAALLVSVLSTKFREYYYNSNWNYQKNGINLVNFVSEVNDFIYELGTRGKFSTINISLYNKDTGELYTCNAGDNKLDIFETDKRRLRRVTLANTPAAGGVSTDLVQMKGGFKVEKTILRHGDTLFMYSDGIDEAERLVRNKDYSVKTHTVETKKFDPRAGKEEIERTIEDVKEQFGEERYRRVVESVLNKRKFILEKEENPTKEILEFDFTNCKGTIDEAINALAAIERVFRMYKTPDIKASDEIEIEKLLDDFLKHHFELYSTYCKPAEKITEEDSKSKNKKSKSETAISSAKKADEDLNVTRYGYVMEDKQADDITLVAIHRP